MKLIVNLLILFAILMASSIQCFSQQAKPFKVRHQGYINGDMTMIANNIVNTAENKDNPNIPYNERTIKGNLNDECSMKYIDIDNDESTFSSSSADLILENTKNKKIIYAGLYWSATYVYNVGKLTRKQKYKPKDSKRESFDNVKIKLPNQESYTTIEGELIFDGIKNSNFSESSPYVMFADITKLVTSSKNPFGTYTIANVKSTIGKISGGISAGWSIFFIYEDPGMTGKFITCYDGFAGITDKSLDIEFSGFQTLPQGNVNAKIACAALEGDFKLKGDQLLFKSSQNSDFSQLSNSLRDKTNIFNSSITIDNAFFETRNPNSSNTLGYDSFIMSIDNPNNSVIGNDTKDATLRLKTYGDRYFMFFTAFNVEVIKPKSVIPENLTDLIVEITNDTIQSDLLNNKNFIKNFNKNDKTLTNPKVKTEIVTTETKNRDKKSNKIDFASKDDEYSVKNPAKTTKKIKPEIVSTEVKIQNKKTTENNITLKEDENSTKISSKTTEKIKTDVVSTDTKILDKKSIDSDVISKERGNSKITTSKTTEKIKTEVVSTDTKIQDKKSIDSDVISKESGNSKITTLKTIEKIKTEVVTSNQNLNTASNDTKVALNTIEKSTKTEKEPTTNIIKTIEVVSANVVNDKPFRITAIESQSVSVPSAPEAYYIIANVFAVPSNATRFIAALKKKGIIADYFINPLNNYRYVYVSNHTNFNEASNYYASNLNGQYYDALWVMTVNKQNNSNYAFHEKSNLDSNLNINNVVQEKSKFIRFDFLKNDENMFVS